MQLTPTTLPGVLLIETTPFADERGWFIRTMDAAEWAEAGVDVTMFVQANHSRSVGGVLRGLHVRSGGGEHKTVRCARGRIWDVVVDLRPTSSTFGRHEHFILDDVRHLQLLLPPGVAHGFAVLSDGADVCYQHSQRYDPDHERAVRWDDPELGVPWPLDQLPAQTPVISERDRRAPLLEQLRPHLATWFSLRAPSENAETPERPNERVPETGTFAPCHVSACGSGVFATPSPP